MSGKPQGARLGDNPLKQFWGGQNPVSQVQSAGTPVPLKPRQSAAADAAVGEAADWSYKSSMYLDKIGERHLKDLEYMLDRDYDTGRVGPANIVRALIALAATWRDDPEQMRLLASYCELTSKPRA